MMIAATAQMVTLKVASKMIKPERQPWQGSVLLKLVSSSANQQLGGMISEPRTTGYLGQAI